MDGRDDEHESERDLACEDAALALNDGGVVPDADRDAEAVMAALEGESRPEFLAALDRLRQLRDRVGDVDAQKLGPEDWALLRAVLRQAEREMVATGKPLTLWL